MTFVAVVYLTALILSLSLVSLMVWRAVRSYLRFRGQMLVTCPENAAAAAVKVDAARAAIMTPVAETSLRLKDCSRWPARKDCGQDCLAAIEASPEDCLVRNILAKWYRGKGCVLCGGPLGDFDWLKHRPALLSPERVTLKWREVDASKLPEIVATHAPVCWNCHIAEAFRREFPESVLDRPWKPGQSHRAH